MMSRDVLSGIFITCLMVAVCAVVPIAGMLVSMFVPLPVMYYRAKGGRQPAAVIAGGTLGLVGFFGTGAEVLFFGGLLLIGFLLGELTERGASIEKTAAITCAGSLAAGLAGLTAYAAYHGTTLVEMLSGAVRYNLELMLEISRQTGVPEDQVRFIADSLDRIETVLVGLMPALAAGSVMIVVWVCLLTARRLFHRHGVHFPDYGELDRWKAPEILVWGVIASGMLLLFPGLSVKTVGLNGLFVFMIVYFFQGIAIVAFFFEKKQVPRALRAVMYGLIAVQHLIVLAVIGVGFFDTWFNFRKLEKPLASQ